MSDSLKGKNGKVRVMYVRSDEESRNRHHTKKNDKRHQDKQPKALYRAKKTVSQADNRSPLQPESTPYAAWKKEMRTEENMTAYGQNQIEPDIEQRLDALDSALIRRQRAEETRVYGENACQALFHHRPEAIIRAWFVQSVTPHFREALRWLAANRKAYHVVEDAELSKVSGTEHHGGVCFLIKKRQSFSVADYLSQQTKHQDCVLALEEVGNPHNLGGMMRSCAYFGVRGIILREPNLLESGAAVRTAEGGAEHIQAINGVDLPATLESFRQAGYTIITTSSHKGTALAQAKLPAKMVLVLGQESDGLSDSIWQQGDLTLSILGTGEVESLNVSVATGIFLAEWWRQQR